MILWRHETYNAASFGVNAKTIRYPDFQEAVKFLLNQFHSKNSKIRSLQYQIKIK